MPRAENERARRRNHRLHKDIELPAANQAVVIRRILAQIETQVPRFLGLDDFARRIPYLGLHAATAHGADHRPILAHQQLRALVARNRPPHLHDRGQRRLLPKPPQPHDLVVNVHPSEL